MAFPRGYLIMMLPLKIHGGNMNSSEGQEKWQEIVDAWRASGLGKAEFCKRQKVVASAFYYWCRKLEGVPRRSQSKTPSKPKRKPVTKAKTEVRKEVAADGKPAFVEISIPKSDTPSPTGQVFRITTSYGAVMEIPI
jgi:hypothetical protein